MNSSVDNSIEKRAPLMALIQQGTNNGSLPGEKNNVHRSAANPAYAIPNKKKNNVVKNSVGSDNDVLFDNFDIEKHTLTECLRYWAIKTKATHAAINMLLHILRTKTDLQVPRNARELLQIKSNGKA